MNREIQKFEELFKKNHQFLCMIAYKIVDDHYVAEDLVQDFFVKYWEKGDKIHLITNFERFAYRSVRNGCIDYLRKKSVSDKRFCDLLSHADFQESESLEIPDNDQRLIRVLKLLDELPVERRKVFELHALEDLSYMQIANKLGISVNTVKTQLRRTYMKFRGKILILLFISAFFKLYFGLHSIGFQKKDFLAASLNSQIGYLTFRMDVLNFIDRLVFKRAFQMFKKSNWK
ncbi:RNA polymerase sigma factor [Pedobacter sp. MC2016-24]|uniref:RNA polymerase sigma factor n=1 Tax=Pedobacter sp. MC2016-24 TaxID=2780090 RepID=UPI001882EF3D|nr:RNA polymerase sigma-70 factor [Pedobacter sp. MC2016-24]MBE9601577.1 RNA polymerase sigma-70 factor [Pedobacter sp. MC2016-24]